MSKQTFINIVIPLVLGILLGAVMVAIWFYFYIHSTVEKIDRIHAMLEQNNIKYIPNE